MANQSAEERTAAGESQQFGRHLSENSMEYMIFLLDESLEGIKYLNRLEDISREAVRLMETVTKNYVWQREDFRLSVANEQGLIYLYGVTDYGDAVEDEWLIVFILRELSKTHTEIFVRVADEDGEFLLVEAANTLPNWLNPEVDHCRVWIHGGSLKIIPLQEAETQSSTTELLTLPGAVQFLRNESDKLIQSPSIEDEAFYRLEKYPEHVEASIHHSTVTVPRKLAYLIHELPKTIPPAVEAFYLRDHDGMKKISSESEGLHLPPTDLVTISVKFSRVLFAQLRSQRFGTPPRWQVVIQGYGGDHTLKGEPNKNMLALEDGMKLTCGYEILAITAEKSKNRTVRELAIMIQDLQEDGEEYLPTNEDIGQWSDVRRKDDESWLDINYEDFERELEGKRSKSSTEGNRTSGFGDSRTQEDLRKIVSRFEAFLNDDSAGLDGAEMDAMDVDDNDDNSDESDDRSDENSDMEDKDVSFDEETFSQMMKEMMGLPVHNPTRASTGQYKGNAGFQSKPTRELSVENEDIKKLSMQMEEELKGHGALRLNEPESKQGRRAVDTNPSDKAKGKQEEVTKSSELQDKGGEEDTDEEIDIDYNLAKNLLESFKSQAGMAGPTGNLLGLMGFQLPRDEDDSEKGG